MNTLLPNSHPELAEAKPEVSPMVPDALPHPNQPKNLSLMRRVDGRWVRLGGECRTAYEINQLLVERGGAFRLQDRDAIVLRTPVLGRGNRYTVLRVWLGAWRVVPNEVGGDPDFPLPGLAD